MAIQMEIFELIFFQVGAFIDVLQGFRDNWAILENNRWQSFIGWLVIDCVKYL